MATSRTLEILREMKEAEEAAKVSKAVNAHPDTVHRVFEMQKEYIPCTFCGTITETDVHVDYNGGISVFTLYKCPKCSNTFMEKDLHNQEN